MVSTFLSASYFGEIIGFLASGWMLERFGWESLFYSFGSLGFLWIPFWIMFAYEKPYEHPKMTKAEADYISATEHSEMDIGDDMGFVTLSGGPEKGAPAL